jgi:soluble lytic murein transglycosylase
MKKITLFVLLFVLFISMPVLCPVNSIFERAITLAQWKYYDDAIVELNRLIPDEKEPWTSRAEFLKGWCLLKKGSFDKAAEIFTKYASDPSFALNDYAKLYLGQAQIGMNKYADAYATLKGVMHESATWPDSVIMRGECLEKTGDIPLAVETYKAMIADKTNSYMQDKARLNLGKCYEKLGSPQAAVKCYHEVNLYYPLSPFAKEAVSHLNALSKRYKINQEAASADEIYNKAMVFYNYGDFNSASATFNKIITGYRNSDLWEDAVFKAAMCDYKKKRLASSIVKFKALVARRGTYADASQFYMAFSYGKSGYFFQALDCLNRVITYFPNSQYCDDAAFYLGYYYEVNGYKNDAKNCFEKFVADYPNSEFAPEAFWKLGRLDYFNKDYLAAYECFRKAVDQCKSGNMLDACAYWKGLVLEKTGDLGGAADAYEYVTRRFDHTYYGYRAAEKLVKMGRTVKYDTPASVSLLPEVSSDNFADIQFSEEPLPFEPGVEEVKFVNMDGHYVKAIDTADHFKKYSELMIVGLFDEAVKEASLLVENAPDDKKSSAKLALASANLAEGKIRESITYADALCTTCIMDGTFSTLPKQTWNLAYPKGFSRSVAQYAAEFGLDECLVLAVIREESRFNPATRSWANARGLMQIIPPTGRTVARLIGIQGYYTNRLHDPDVNIKMGCYYLSQLLKRFNGNKYLAVAAYNGGPVRVQKWMKKWQAEYGMDNVDLDEFVESIPLTETRHYVQKVMKSYNEYRRLYFTEPANT